jgi:hypothetical protein
MGRVAPYFAHQDEAASFKRLRDAPPEAVMMIGQHHNTP